MLSLRAPFFFRCHTTGDAFVTPPGCTGSRLPCRTIVSSFSFTLSWRGRGIFLALQNICCDPGMSFTCALYTLTAGSLSSLTALTPSWGSMSLPSSPNFLSDCATASCCCLYLLPFHSTSHVSDPRSVSSLLLDISHLSHQFCIAWIESDFCCCCCLYLLPFHSTSHVSDPRSVS